mgnify:CR=1 FL=1
MAEAGVAMGLLVGLVLGLTGAGGSILAVPLLMAGLGWSLTQAVPVSLLAVTAAASFGAVVAWRSGIVRYRAALLMATAGVLAAPQGLALAEKLPAQTLALLFAGLLVVVAVRLLLQACLHPQETTALRAALGEDPADNRQPACEISTQTGRIVWTQPCMWVISLTGALTGLLSGLLGVGGGFVVVPALRAVTRLSIHAAVATSLMTIALTSFGTVVVSVWQGRHLPLQLALPFVLGAVLGMAAGRRLAPGIAGPLLQQGFATLMLLAAAGMGTHAVGWI